ncbi:MAG TPA: YqhA family protein [Spirochaetota bacterium]|mgnify:FL=1|nr:YqhA family protein [Spirochaetota bacterium]HPN83020.1 YqhA family protein [Spirochaetota bacterium]
MRTQQPKPSSRPKGIKSLEEQGPVERVFESALWNSRFFVLSSVIFGLLGSMTLFFIASVDIITIVVESVESYLGMTAHHVKHAHVLAQIIAAIDLYLIAVVLLIFSFGLYELFISRIDIAAKHTSLRLLQIHSLDGLKDKITKVIIMVLIVSFFEKVLSMNYSTPLDMLFLAASILALAVGLYFLRKSNPEA